MLPRGCVHTIFRRDPQPSAPPPPGAWLFWTSVGKPATKSPIPPPPGCRSR